MSPIGLDFLRERRAMRAFENQDPSYREVVFYSEGASDWPHLGPVLECLLREHDQRISYLTSDGSDPALSVSDSRLRVFQIGSGTVRTILFARMNCRKFVMTLPDLGKLWLKRSVHPVHYVYLFHSTNSTHTAYRKGAFDEYDTVFCVGPHHVDEIRRTENAYGLRPKNLVEHGSAKLDTVMAQLDREGGQPAVGGGPRVLIAPSWGECSLIERPVGRRLLATLLEGGYRTTLRLHPMTVRRLPALVRDIGETHGAHPLFELEADMSASRSWLESDLMISDWSGAAIEYAFALQKPVVYVDTPQKILNTEAERIGLEAFEAVIRREIGAVVAESDTDTIGPVIDGFLRRREALRESILAARSRWIYNVGSSSAVAAAQLVAGLSPPPRTSGQ